MGMAWAGTRGIFYSDQDSRLELFPKGTRFIVDTLEMDSTAAETAGTMLKHPVREKEVLFERILAEDVTLGYIYRAHERGKVELMDFAVALDTLGTVQRVLLTVYRENIGGEVGSKRFMIQFKGKTAASALELHRDVDGISGATLSSRAITLGVRKAVCFWKLKYAKT